MPPQPVSSNRIHSLISSPRSCKLILILSTHLRLLSSSCLFHSDFINNKFHVHLLSTTRATDPAHLFLLDTITGKIFGLEWISSISSSRAENFLFFETSRPFLGSPQVNHASSYRLWRQLSLIRNYKLILSNNFLAYIGKNYLLLLYETSPASLMYASTQIFGNWSFAFLSLNKVGSKCDDRAVCLSAGPNSALASTHLYRVSDTDSCPKRYVSSVLQDDTQSP